MLPAFHDSPTSAHSRMKPPSKPFFVEVKRSRSIPAQPAPPTPRPTSSSWEDAPEPAGGTRSKAWQHAEQFFQPRPANQAPEPRTLREQPAPVPVEAAAEPKAEVKVAAERARKPAKAAKPAPEKPADAASGAEPEPQARKADATVAKPRRAPKSSPAPQQPAFDLDLDAEVDADVIAAEEPVYLPLDGLADGDEARADGRKPLSARAARSAAKPAERWTCRLRHVRRNLGPGRIGQLRP